MSSYAMKTCKKTSPFIWKHCDFIKNRERHLNAGYLHTANNIIIDIFDVEIHLTDDETIFCNKKKENVIKQQQNKNEHEHSIRFNKKSFFASIKGKDERCKTGETPVLNELKNYWMKKERKKKHMNCKFKRLG